MEDCDHGSKINCIDSGENSGINDGCCLSEIIDDEEKWGDYNDKLRGLFDQVLMGLLKDVYDKKGSRPIPALLEDRVVDLFKLFCLVTERGGYGMVSEEKLWGLIAENMGFDCNSCGLLKLIYYKYFNELDQLLNRTTRHKGLESGSNERKGSLGLLCLELEKTLRGFLIDEKGISSDDDVGYDKICNSVGVSIKENLHIPDAEEGSEVHNVVATFDVDKGNELCCTKKQTGKEKASTSVEDSAFRKRKRDMIGGMLNWIIKVAKNPCYPSIGVMPGCSRWKENDCNDFWSIALFVREERLQKRYIEPNNLQSYFNQKKYKMHPSMYDDDLSNHHSAGRLRCSERLVSLENIPLCQCCKSSSAGNCKFNRTSNSLPENEFNMLEDANADFSDKILVDRPSVDDLPFEKHVLVGPKFQAVVPVWTGKISESDPKWLGTQIWAPDLKEENSCCKIELLRNERPESCQCLLRGSVECHRCHIAENRMKLRRELGLAFYHWKFDGMGEEVSLSWSPEEEKKFKHIIKLNEPSLGKSFFPKRTRKELVSYYFNVFLINRRSYQNRATPKDVDSDNDEAEFGSVGGALGYNAVKIPGSEPMMQCIQSEQVYDFN